MAISRCAVECATPRCALASDSRTRGWSRNIIISRSALSTDAIGYAGRCPFSVSGREGTSFCTAERYGHPAVLWRVSNVSGLKTSARDGPEERDGGQVTHDCVGQRQRVPVPARQPPAQFGGRPGDG